MEKRAEKQEKGEMKRSIRMKLKEETWKSDDKNNTDMS